MAIKDEKDNDPDSSPSGSSLPVGPRHRLYQLGKALYRAVPPRLRAYLYPIAEHGLLLRRLRPEVWILTGDERGSHLPLSVCLYATTSEYKSYLQSRIFGSVFQARYIGRAWLWRAFKRLPSAASSCSLLIAEVHERHIKWMGADAGVAIPAWIRGHVPLPRGVKVMKRFSIKNILRAIRRNGLEYEVTQDPKSFDDFYDNMYVPYSKARYGDSAFIDPREKLKAKFEIGDLIFVKRQDEYLSGLLVTYVGDVAVLPYLGVRDGNWEYVTDGTLAGQYEFVLQHLEQRGCIRADLGQTRAFLNDGVLLFKKKYGHAIDGTGIHYFLTKVLSNTNATQAFLQNNPFIFRDAGVFRGAVFLDPGVPPTTHTLQEIHKQYSQTGLSELIAFFLSVDRAAAPPSINLEPLPDNTNDPTAPAQPHYQPLAEAEYAPLIKGLGPIGIATAIGIRPPDEE